MEENNTGTDNFSLTATQSSDSIKTVTPSETQSLTRTMDNLQLDLALKHDCIEKSGNITSFRTYEKDKMKLHVFSEKILYHQGYQHSVEEIAPVWKKDCRTWLWKGVQNSKKQRKQISKLN